MRCDVLAVMAKREACWGRKGLFVVVVVCGEVFRPE
jgi:hypothetical protein